MSDKTKAMQTMTLARAIDLINEQERRIAKLEAEKAELTAVVLVGEAVELERRVAELEEQLKVAKKKADQWDYEQYWAHPSRQGHGTG